MVQIDMHGFNGPKIRGSGSELSTSIRGFRTKSVICTARPIGAELLGLEDFIPPFANLSGSDILKGVNYASGSAGIRKESGTNLGTNINMGLQIYFHMAIVSQISARLGFHKAKRHLSQCLYYVNIGTNDYEQNYFLPDLFDTSSKYTPEEYAKDLINRLSHYLQILRNLGARKTVLVGLDRLGCIPKDEIGESCDEKQNAEGFLFNDQLKSLVDEHNKLLSNSKFIFINTTAIVHDKSHGFTYIHDACCLRNKDGVCDPNQTPCQNRSEYVYWDGIHGTEAANVLTATISYNTSDTAIAYPTNIRKLVHQKEIN